MKRNESKDVFVLTEDGSPVMSEMCISTYPGSLLDESADENQTETRYVPFAQLETEREVLRDVKREAGEIIAKLKAIVDGNCDGCKHEHGAIPGHCYECSRGACDLFEVKP